MTTPLPPALRALVVAAALVAGLSACGRRGALEPPPNPRVPAAAANATANAETADDETPETLLPSATPKPQSSRESKRGYTIPKEPFILDPLL